MKRFLKTFIGAGVLIGILFQIGSPLLVLAQVSCDTPGANPATCIPSGGLENSANTASTAAGVPISCGSPGANPSTCIPTGGLEQPANQVPQTAQATQNTKNLGDLGICSGTTNLTPNFLSTRCMGWAMMSMGGLLLAVGGWVLNYSIEISIFGMKKIVDDVGAINVVWKTFRDLSNIFFIFILIYIGISTILGFTDSQKWKLLRNVILVALFINFSLFFTKIVIDASNIVTVQFYNSIARGPSASENGLSYVFMEASRLKTVFETRDNTGSTIFRGAEGTNFLAIGFMSMLFFVILAFCFIAIGLLFLIRFAVFIMLMVLSPFAFLGHTVPQFKQVWNIYIENLMKQFFFAPVMMAIIWMVAAIMNSPGFMKAMRVDATAAAAGNNFSQFFTGSGSATMVVINFAILIILLIAGMVVANQFSFQGTKGVINTFDRYSRRVIAGATVGTARITSRAGISTTAFAGRQIIGRTANALQKSAGIQKWAGDSRVGAVASKALGGVANANFDVRGIAGVGNKLGVGAGGGEGFVGRREAFRETMDKTFQRDQKSLDYQADQKRQAEIKEDADIIKAGSVAGATPTTVAAVAAAKAKLKQNLGKLSEDQAVEMAANWHKWYGNTISEQEDIIKNFSPDKVGSILKKAGLNPKEKEAIIKVREQDLRTELADIKIGTAVGATAAQITKANDNIRKLQRMSDKELEILSDDIFSLEEFSVSLSRRQSKALTDNDKIDTLNKEAFRQTRRSYLEKALRMNVKDDVKKISIQLTGDELSRLNLPGVIASPGFNHLLDNLSGKQLAEAGAVMNATDTSTLRAEYEARALRTVTSPTATSQQFKDTVKWLNSSPGQQLF